MTSIPARHVRKVKGLIYQGPSLYLEPMAPVTYMDAEKMIGKEISKITAAEDEVILTLSNGDAIKISGAGVDVSLIKKA